MVVIYNFWDIGVGLMVSIFLLWAECLIDLEINQYNQNNVLRSTINKKTGIKTDSVVSCNQQLATTSFKTNVKFVMA